MGATSPRTSALRVSPSPTTCSGLPHTFPKSGAKTDSVKAQNHWLPLSRQRDAWPIPLEQRHLPAAPQTLRMTSRPASTLPLTAIPLHPAPSSYAGSAGPSVAGGLERRGGGGADCFSAQGRRGQPKPCVCAARIWGPSQSRSLHSQAFSIYPHGASAPSAKAAVLSPAFPFVFKGRSDDWQPQSNDLDLGVHSLCCRLTATHSHRAGRGMSSLRETLPQPPALRSSPGCSTGIFLSTKRFLTFFHPPHHGSCSQVSNLPTSDTRRQDLPLGLLRSLEEWLQGARNPILRALCLGSAG